MQSRPPHETSVFFRLLYITTLPISTALELISSNNDIFCDSTDHRTPIISTFQFCELNSILIVCTARMKMYTTKASEQVRFTHIAQFQSCPCYKWALVMAAHATTARIPYDSCALHSCIAKAITLAPINGINDRFMLGDRELIADSNPSLYLRFYPMKRIAHWRKVHAWRCALEPSSLIECVCYSWNKFMENVW